jgi:phage recombination protein Bet
MTDSALVASYVDPDVSAAMQVYERLNPLKDALGLDKLTIPEMQLFAMVALHTGLDPFTRQIYAIKRGGKVTHQTGIDGYRSTAERTKEYRGSDAAEFDLCECGDPGSPKVHPTIARVTVHRAYPEGIRPQIGEARWHELKPNHFKPQNAEAFLDAMWWQMPFNQLAKCAEAAGLRKAFPRVLGGVYIAEEMEQDRTVEGEAHEVTVRKPLTEKIAEKAAAIVAPPPDPDPEPDEQPIVGEFTPEEIHEAVDHGSALCGWRLAAKGGAIVPCSFADGHADDHSWREIALQGGRVLRPDAPA